MSTLPSLSPRQEQALRIIAEQIKARGFSPSMRELSAALNLNSSNPNLHLTPLIKKGYVEKDATRPTHSLVLTDRAKEWLKANPDPQRELPLPKDR